MSRFADSVVIACLLAGTAVAQPSTRTAKAHFQRGEAAQSEGRYQEAIEEYQLAYALVPHANALFNIAVCYEKLGAAGPAADYYQGYLDSQKREGGARDAAEVTQKIRDLRAKTASTPPDEPSDAGNGESPQPPPDVPPRPLGSPGIVEGPQPPPSTLSRWHAGVSYGVGFGDAPIERYLVHGGLRFFERLDLDAMLGSFGRNDRALGVMARLNVAKPEPAIVFAHAGLTIGHARQDDSSAAATKFPIGFEAGAGLKFGVSLVQFELTTVVRWLAGGFDETSTQADSYVNDSMIFAIDLGMSFDASAISAVR